MYIYIYLKARKCLPKYSTIPMKKLNIGSNNHNKKRLRVRVPGLQLNES